VRRVGDQKVWYLCHQPGQAKNEEQGQEQQEGQEQEEN